MKYLILAAALLTAWALPAAAQDARHLVQTDDGASCFGYTVVDADGAEVQLPDEVRQALTCPSLASLSPDGNLLLFDDGSSVLLHDLNSNKTSIVMDLEPTVEGVSGAVWSSAGDAVLFAGVDQQHYPLLTRLYLIFLDDEAGFWLGLKDVRMNMTCGSICASTPGEDYRFDADGNIIYATYDQAPYDLEGKDAERMVEPAAFEQALRPGP